MDSFLILVPFIGTIFLIIICTVLTSSIKAGTKRGKVSRRYLTVSSDGHRVPKDEDLTCETMGHDHGQTSKEYGPRYIVHNEPDDGEVVLNGVKVRVKDCENL